MSPATARTWATIISGGVGTIASTPTVFCAVSAVIAVIPCTPQRANAFRSAWIPAPPPESEPAIAEARLGTTRSLRTTRRRLAGRARYERTLTRAGASRACRARA